MNVGLGVEICWQVRVARVFVWVMEIGLDIVQNTFFGMLDRMRKIHFCVDPKQIRRGVQVLFGV